VAHLIYDDVGAAVDALADMFGFHERTVARHTSADGTVGRTQLQVVESVITLGLPWTPTATSGPSRSKSSTPLPRTHPGEGAASSAAVGNRRPAPLDDALAKVRVALGEQQPDVDDRDHQGQLEREA